VLSARPEAAAKRQPFRFRHQRAADAAAAALGQHGDDVDVIGAPGRIFQFRERVDGQPLRR
jgi:hypothetical protein